MHSRSVKKGKREAKSTEKRYNPKKIQLNLFLYKNAQLPERILQRQQEEIQENHYTNKITDRTKAKSSLSGYNPTNKYLHLKVGVLPNSTQEEKAHIRVGWMNPSKPLF